MVLYCVTLDYLTLWRFGDDVTSPSPSKGRHIPSLPSYFDSTPPAPPPIDLHSHGSPHRLQSPPRTTKKLFICNDNLQRTKRCRLSDAKIGAADFSATQV